MGKGLQMDDGEKGVLYGLFTIVLGFITFVVSVSVYAVKDNRMQYEKERAITTSAFEHGYEQVVLPGSSTIVWNKK
jgi:hypothetical protein